MHDLEPHYGWREIYISSNDEKSPFYGAQYDEFKFHNKVYNYFIHPQWDAFGTETLYLKILFVDYEENFSIIELIGEWNDCLHNDVMFLKREIIDKMIDQGITKFVLCCDKVMNFHYSDTSYYEEWHEEVAENNGWICVLESQEHVRKEWNNQRLNYYMNYGQDFDDIIWRKLKPANLKKNIEQIIQTQTPLLP